MQADTVVDDPAGRGLQWSLRAQRAAIRDTRGVTYLSGAGRPGLDEGGSHAVTSARCFPIGQLGRCDRAVGCDDGADAVHFGRAAAVLGDRLADNPLAGGAAYAALVAQQQGLGSVNAMMRSSPGRRNLLLQFVAQGNTDGCSGCDRHQREDDEQRRPGDEPGVGEVEAV